MKSALLRRFYPYILVIAVVAAAFSFAIVTENITREAIQSHLDQEALGLLRQIFPDVGYYIFADDIYTVYTNGGVRAGYAFYGEGNGYGGEMQLFIGLEDRDTIQGIIVISHRETPMYWATLVREEFFIQFEGLLLEDCYLRGYSGQGGEVDGVSGSTYSSRGVTDAVRKTSLDKIKLIVSQ